MRLIKTSAAKLLEYAELRWRDSDDRRVWMIRDLYIKACSYIFVNKAAFIGALLFGILVPIWPTVAVISEYIDPPLSLLQSSIVQTTITSLAAFTFAVYHHYKKRQLHVENLMRRIVFSGGYDAALIDRIIHEMERIDSGFSFGDTIGDKGRERSDPDAHDIPPKADDDEEKDEPGDAADDIGPTGER